jgi:nucleoside-diphosphate-sugar epimerase
VDRAAIFALIDAAVASGEPRVVIYTSGVWTLGEGGGHEDSPADHPARTSQHRPALERDVLAAADSNVATAVIRPGMVYGGREGLAHLLCGVIGDGAPTYIGEGRNRWTPVHRDDVGELYRLVAEKQARGIYHAAEPEAVEARELARLLHEAGARPPQSLPHAQAMEKLGLLGEALAMDSVLVARRAWDLGWRPQSRFAVTVNQTWKEFIGE